MRLLSRLTTRLRTFWYPLTDILSTGFVLWPRVPPWRGYDGEKQKRICIARGDILMKNRYPLAKCPLSEGRALNKYHWSRYTPCNVRTFQTQISLAKLSPEAKQMVWQDLKQNAPEQAAQLKEFGKELAAPDSLAAALKSTFEAEWVLNASDLSLETKIAIRNSSATE